MGVSLNSQARRSSTFAKRPKFAGDQQRGLLNEQGLGGVHYVVRSQAIVEPAGMLGATIFGDSGGEA